MSFNCVLCGFEGKDKYALDRHNETDKHMENLGISIADKLELKDIRLMNDDERRTYIRRHRYFKVEHSPQLADHFKKSERFKYIKNLLNSNPTKLSLKQMELRKQEIRDEYPDDYEGDEIKERIEMLEYDLDNLEEFIAEKDILMLYFTGPGMKIASAKALGDAEECVRKRMMLEFDSVNIAKSKQDKKKAELELKIKLLELRNS